MKYLSRGLRRLPFVWTACRFVAATSREWGVTGAGELCVWGGSLDPTPRVTTNTRGLSAAKVEHGRERQPVASAAQWGNWDSVSRRRRRRRRWRWGERRGVTAAAAAMAAAQRFSCMSLHQRWESKRLFSLSCRSAHWEFSTCWCRCSNKGNFCFFPRLLAFPHPSPSPAPVCMELEESSLLLLLL